MMQRFNVKKGGISMLVEDNIKGPYCLHDQAQQEIETLRNKFEIECAAHERSMQNRDEWKRRAQTLHTYIKEDLGGSGWFEEDNPEAANWFSVG